MQFLFRLAALIGRCAGFLRRALVQILLSLIYLFGMGLAAAGLLFRLEKRKSWTDGGYHRRDPEDLTLDGLNRMG